jgi:hypothetical protein
MITAAREFEAILDNGRLLSQNENPNSNEKTLLRMQEISSYYSELCAILLMNCSSLEFFNVVFLDLR